MKTPESQPDTPSPSRLVIRVKIPVEAPPPPARQPVNKFALLLGLAALAVVVVLSWFAIFSAIQLVYIRFVEEPGLERRFGEPYREYKLHVRAWIPRLRPWRGDPSGPGPTPHAID